MQTRLSVLRGAACGPRGPLGRNLLQAIFAPALCPFRARGLLTQPDIYDAKLQRRKAAGRRLRRAANSRPPQPEASACAASKKPQLYCNKYSPRIAFGCVVASPEAMQDPALSPQQKKRSAPLWRRPQRELIPSGLVEGVAEAQHSRPSRGEAYILVPLGSGEGVGALVVLEDVAVVHTLHVAPLAV